MRGRTERGGSGRTGADVNTDGSASLEDWESDVAVMDAEEAELRAQGRWLRGPHDLLSVISRRRHELTHSAALAWLLDPMGAHGLGAAPLAGLLDLIGDDVPGDDVLGLCRPSREVGIAGTIADLVIDGPGLRVVVEVKIDAAEGERQAERLVQHFDTGATSFVFLTLSGAAPVTAAEHLGRWSAVSWSEILAMLDDVRRHGTPAERAVAAVDAYLESLRRIA